MKNNYIVIFMSILLLFIFISSNGQVGIGTSTPRGALDINSPTTNNSGLVLPTNIATTNILNPQGGTIAEGTIMYDSTNQCVRFFNGSAWSNCLCDSCGDSSPGVDLDCSEGFSDEYKVGVALSEATYKVTITNNSFSTATINFQTSDLELSGVSGITVSSVSPATVNIAPEASEVITYNLSGTPATEGTLNGSWNKSTLACNNTTLVQNNTTPPVGTMVRVGYWSSYTIGSTSFLAFNSQLENPVNYGSSGTHTGNFEGFSFTNITTTLNSLTVDQLLESYDIISTGYANMSVANAAKIKEYVDRGGVAIIKLDRNIGTNLFNAFGGTGSVRNGVRTAILNTNAINSGTFGDASNVTLAGSDAYGSVTVGALPPNSTILGLSPNGASAQVFLTGTDDRAIFFWDEGVFRNPSVSGSIIDTPQEVALHNYISLMLRKKGY